MMQSTEFKAEQTQDNSQNNSTKPKDSNPCGICRAMGLPVCKGHGGSGGGGDSEGNEKSADQDPKHAPANTLELTLAKSGLWNKADADGFRFEFNNPDALMSLTLDMGRGLMLFVSPKDLSKEEQKALDEYYQQIRDEFNTFKKELAASGVDVDQMSIERDANNLTIKIPSPKYYDAFVQRLMDKNLLITQVAAQDLHSLSAPHGIIEEPAPKSTAPTPFDMSGPKPKGWDIKG